MSGETSIICEKRGAQFALPAFLAADGLLLLRDLGIVEQQNRLFAAEANFDQLAFTVGVIPFEDGGLLGLLRPFHDFRLDFDDASVGIDDAR